MGDRFFKGSGTSQAAAYVSGAAALILQQRPYITPDQLKALLIRYVSPLPVANLVAQGAGVLNLDRDRYISTYNLARQTTRRAPARAPSRAPAAPCTWRPTARP